MNSRPRTLYLDDEGANVAAMAVARKEAEEALRLKLKETGVSRVVNELRVARSELARRAFEANYVADRIMGPARDLLETRGLGTWDYVLPPTAADAAHPCGCLLMPYEWRWQYEEVLGACIKADDPTDPIPISVKNGMRSILDLDKTRFAASWSTSPSYSGIRAVLLDDGASNGYYRVATMAYFLERDVWGRLPGDGFGVAAPAAPVVTPAIGNGLLNSIKRQSQWLSAILLYQLRMAFDALPGMDATKTLVVRRRALDANPILAYPDTPLAQGRDLAADDEYPDLIWATSLSGPNPDQRSLVEDGASGHLLRWDWLLLFGQVFGKAPLPIQDVPTAQALDTNINKKYVTLDVPGMGISNASWITISGQVRDLGSILVYPKLREQLLRDNRLLGRRTGGQYSHVPCLADYIQVCDLLDRSRAPLLARFFAEWTGPERLFGMTLETDTVLLANRPDRPPLGARSDDFDDRLGTLLPGTLFALYQTTKDALNNPIQRVSSGDIPAVGSANYPILERYINYTREPTIDVSLFLPDVFNGAFPVGVAPRTILTPDQIATTSMIQTVTLPIITHVLAERVQSWMHPPAGFGRQRQVRLRTDPNRHLELPFDLTSGPDVSGLLAPLLPEDQAKAEKQVLEEETRRTARTAFLTRLFQEAGAEGTARFLAENATSLLTTEPRLIEQVPWASIALWLRFVVWAFSQPDSRSPTVAAAGGAAEMVWISRVREWQKAVDDLDAKLRTRLPYDASDQSVADYLRRDDLFSPSADYMARPEFSGRLYFSSHFKALLRLGMIFVRKFFGDSVSLDELTAVFHYPDLATAFAVYLGAVEAKRGLQSDNVYKTDMNHKYQGAIALQEAENGLRKAIAEHIRGGRVSAIPANKRARTIRGWLRV